MNFETFKLKLSNMLKTSTNQRWCRRTEKFQRALLQFRVIVTKRVETAATDGLVILLNEDFFSTLSFEEQIGLLTHEILHVRFDHPRRFLESRFTNQHQANVAMDYEINSLMVDRGLHVPSGGMMPSKNDLPNLQAWEWYAIQLEKLDKEDQYPYESDDSDDSQESDDSDDSGDSQESGDSGDSGDSKDIGSNGDSGKVESGCHEAGSLVEEFAPDMVDELEDMLDEIEIKRDAVECEPELEDAIDEQEEKRGIGSESSRGAKASDGEMAVAADGERWQDLVIDTFRSDGDEIQNDWSRRSRRSRQQGNSFMPSAKNINGLSLALIVDASGSCTDWFGLWRSLANELVEECRGVQRLEIIVHDTKVLSHTEWNRGEGEVELDLIYGGGTCHRQCIPYADNLDVDGIVLLTDNQSRWPESAPESLLVSIMCPDSSDHYRCPYGINIMATLADAVSN